MTKTIGHYTQVHQVSSTCYKKDINTTRKTWFKYLELDRHKFPSDNMLICQEVKQTLTI